MAAQLAQYITVVDKSNKVVGTSKQLKNVFKEAKSAYLEKRAEIQAERRAKEDRELRKAQRAVEAMSIAESETASRASSHTRRPKRRDDDERSRHTSRRHLEDERPRMHERHASATSVRSGYSGRSSMSESPRHGSRESSRSPRSPHTPLGQFNEQLENTRSAPASPHSPNRKSTELVRRRTDNLGLAERPPHRLSRSYSAHEMEEHVDMDLAYGEYHPESLGLALDPRVEQKLQEQELSSLVLKAKMLLDEANCAQHSVKAIVQHLQKNPDAMAAVALTLAEISNIASKMAPGALALMKTGAPAVFGLLAAPEFLIAVGVGVGITVVMFGGYKIIKKIKGKMGDEKEGSMDEAIDVGELDRIEHWRRGIADVDAAETASVASFATSVEGEYITPMAARSMGHVNLAGKDGKEGKKKEKKEKKYRKKEGSEAASEVSKSSRRSSKLDVPKDKSLIKIKKPSPLRSMFRSKDGSSTAS